MTFPPPRVESRPSLPVVRVLPGYSEICEAAAEHLARSARSAISERGRFMLALSGGSTPRGLYRRLAEPPYRESVPWDRVHLFWGDERWVPPEDEDSNYGMARDAFLDAVPVPPRQVQPVPTHLGSPEEAAAAYAETLAAAFSLPGEGLPRFDLLLLGVGRDGHVASLFPSSPASAERRRLVVAVEPPPGVRPAHRRISLTLPVLNAAREVVVLVRGKQKAATVAKILRALRGEGTPRMMALPAARVRPKAGRLTWYLDREAAAELPSQGISGVGAAPPEQEEGGR